MSPRDEMLLAMNDRSIEHVPKGTPIIPEGPLATTEDMQEFKRLVQLIGYQVKFGQPRAVTKPRLRVVTLTPSCSVGTLSDEYFHVWNNVGSVRGMYLERGAEAEEHRALGQTLRISGSSNDRRFHQLELRNYVRCLRNSPEPIPIFVWRTFRLLRKAR